MSLTNAKVYSIPFTVQTSSTMTSDIKRHFTDSIQEENHQLNSSFRGRPLNGTNLKLPDDYLGVVSNGSKAISSFNQLTYFNLDCPTSDKDSIARSVQWLSLAKALHE